MGHLIIAVYYIIRIKVGNICLFVCLSVCLFELWLSVQVNSYGHFGMGPPFYWTSAQH